MISRTLDDKHWLVLFVLDNGPLQVYHYDRENGRAEFPFTYQCVRWTAPGEDLPGGHQIAGLAKSRKLLHAAADLERHRWRRWPRKSAADNPSHQMMASLVLQVACADQRPFAVHLLQSPQQELPESPALLDLAEYRLHSLHPQSVALPTPPGL